MNRYLIPIQKAENTDTLQRISVEDDPVGIYRLDDTYDVVAEVGDQVIQLNPQDATVSRKKDGTVPIELASTEDGIKIKNKNSTNEITVKNSDEVNKLSINDSIEITNECMIRPGYNIRLRANIRGLRGSEPDNPESVHDKMQSGVEIQAYIDKLASNISLSMEADKVAKCRNNLQELHDTMVESPIQDQAYDDAVDSVESMIGSLDAKLNDKTRVTEFDEQKRNSIKQITTRVSNLYSRY